jgi:hypothetical protein
MEVPEFEAREALKVVTATEERSRKSRNYRYSSPHLVLWGLIWIAGYTVDGLTSPKIKELIWTALVLVLVGVIVGMRLPAARDHPAARVYGAG